MNYADALFVSSSSLIKVGLWKLGICMIIARVKIMARAQPGGDSGVIFTFVEEDQCFGML